MAEAETMEPTADRRTVHRDIVKLFQFQTQLVQGRIAPLRQTRAHPGLKSIQLAGSAQIALPLRQKPARLSAQLDHVIDEFRRNPKMPGRLPVTMPLIDKGDDTLS